MAMKNMNEIADARKKDAEARNAAAKYQGDYLTTELDKQMNPIFKEGTAEDIADAVCFLALEQSRFVTGQVLCCDGGRCI